MQLASFFKRGLIVLLISCLLVIFQIRKEGWRSPITFFTKASLATANSEAADVTANSKAGEDSGKKLTVDVELPIPEHPVKKEYPVKKLAEGELSGKEQRKSSQSKSVANVSKVRVLEWLPYHAVEKDKQNASITEYHCDGNSCVDCSRYGNGTCPKCYTVDHETGVFALHNVAFSSGRPLVSGEKLTAQRVVKCYRNCQWHLAAEHRCQTGPTYGLFAQSNVWETRLLDNVKHDSNGSISMYCKAFTEIAVVVTDHSMKMFFHYILERMYELFSLLGAISEKHGCAEKKISVFFAKLEPSSVVTDLWKAMFGERQDYKRMNGCYHSVYYGVPWKGGRISTNAGGQTTIFEYNHRNSRWASLFALKTRIVWRIPHVPSTKSSMLILRHTRTPIWFWNMNFSYAGVVHVAGEFERKPMTYQVQMVSEARGIISAEGAGFVWQIFLRPRSALFSLSLNLIAMNRKSDNLLPWAQWCHERPGCVHDVWAAHLGHSILSWRWCHPWPFQKDKIISRNIAITALKWLLEQNEKARENNYAWICHVLERQDLGHIEKFIRKNVSMNFCDKEILVYDRDLEAFRDPDKAEYQSRTCGSFGRVGPSLLSKTPRFTCNVAKNGWGASCKDKVSLGCGGTKCTAAS